MLAVARRRARELRLAGVEFRVEDAHSLSFADGSVDGVLCRFGLMLVPDLSAAAEEIARVLRPGGKIALAVWAAPDGNDWLTASGRSALELGLIERPDPAAPGPFRLAADGALKAVLVPAGLHLHAVEDVPLTWRAASLDEWWRVARDTSRTLSALLDRIGPAEARAVREGAERRLARWLGRDDGLAVPGLARVALASRPA